MFLQITDFDNYPYKLDGVQNMPNSFTPFVNQTEENGLIKLLGYGFFKEMKDQLDEETPLQIWTNLRDGSEYTYKNKLKVWVGMKTLLKPLVFFKWISETLADQKDGIRVIPKMENSEVVSPQVWQVNAYNDFAFNAGTHHYKNSEHPKGSLYEFLTAGEYPDFDFCFPKYINRFNL